MKKQAEEPINGCYTCIYLTEDGCRIGGSSENGHTTWRSCAMRQEYALSLIAEAQKARQAA